MPVCANQGCKQSYSEEENSDTACTYHPAAPIFHEGLKGWSCCSRRVTEFDEFLNIPGCATGRHKPAEEQEAAPTAAPQKAMAVATRVVNDVEIYGSDAAAPVSTEPAPTPQVSKPDAQTEEPLEDDPSIPVQPGTKCKRNACDKEYVDEATSRGDGAGAECVYHPGTAVFHEGSKGWSCCSRKVLEFEEFLKIKGCKSGRHLFVGSGKEDAKKDQSIQCRLDWYQTPSSVNVSVFAKKVDKNRSTVTFGKQELHIDLTMEDGKHFKANYPLFQLIEPDKSTYEILTTKVEIKLKKGNGFSWQSLQPSENIATTITFGVTDGSATIGGKEMYVAPDTPIHVSKQ